MLRVYPTSMAAGAALPEEMRSVGGDKTLVIGIGGSGCQLLKRVYEQHSKTPDLRFLAINSDYKELRLLADLGIPRFELKRSVSPIVDEDTEKPPLDLSMFNGQGAGGDPSVGKRMMLENVESFLKEYIDLEKELGGRDTHFCRVIFLYGYGGGTGAGASLVLAEALREKYPYLELYALVVTPRIAGSAERMDEIVKVVKEMEQYVDVFIPIDQDGLYRAYRDKPQAEASAKLYDVALKNINAFLLMIGVPTEKNIDASDLARGLGVRSRGEQRQAQCVIAGYVEGKLDDLPSIIWAEKVPDSELLRLLYAAVPGEFIYFRNVRGARVGIVKIVYGEDVCPSMNQLRMLEEQVQALAKAAPGEFTLMLSYGPSKSVPKGEYKFAVFFSQFEDENKMPLSERMQTDYNKWKDKEQKKQRLNDLVMEFDTYREEDDELINLVEPPRGDAQGEALPEQAPQQAAISKVGQPEVKVDQRIEQQQSIADLAQQPQSVMKPIIEEQLASGKRGRMRAAAAQMGTFEATREIGKPMQRELNLAMSEGVETVKGINPLSMDSEKAAEAWQRWEKEKENSSDGKQG